MENWQVRDRQTVFECPIFKIEENKATNPRNQRDGRYFIAHYPDWVNVIALTKDKKVVLVKQYRHGIAKMDSEIPGGMIDPEDNNPLEAGLRELEEETGYIAGKARVLGKCSPNPALQGNYCHFILAEDVELKAEVRPDDGENIEVFTAPLSEIPQLIKEGTISNAMVIAAFYALDKI